MSREIIVETSARHVHLKQEDIDTLFGKGHQLTPKKDLSQPGQFACEERVEIVGPKKSIANVIILGPARPDSQVEISLTDARTMGINAAIRESGDIEGTEGCKIVGPCGEVVLEKGVIAAKRHLHLAPADAEEIGVENKQIVKVKINGSRPLIFDDVVVRVSDKFARFMHIDTDEANAAGATPNIVGEVIVD
ncbi:MAG: phosphate propanoyltransferase [Clostridia bacterium]|nr:phosphate propanoyltransferase [Clostridia bacterium]